MEAAPRRRRASVYTGLHHVHRQAGASALATNLNWGSNERGSPAPLTAGEGRDLWGAKVRHWAKEVWRSPKPPPPPPPPLSIMTPIMSAVLTRGSRLAAERGAGRTRTGGDNLNLNCRGVFGAMIPSEMRQYEVKKLWAHFCAPQNRTRSLSAGAGLPLFSRKT